MIIIKHAPYKGSTKSLINRLHKPGATVIADSEKQAVAINSYGRVFGIKVSRARNPDGTFLVRRVR